MYAMTQVPLPRKLIFTAGEFMHARLTIYYVELEMKSLYLFHQNVGATFIH